MTITPVGNKIYLKMDTVKKVGDLVTENKKTIHEFAEVLAVGPEVTIVKKGDHIFLKSWAVDIINHEKEEYFFISQNSDGICALVHK